MPTTGLTSKDLPNDYDALIVAHPPYHIADEVAYENALELMGALVIIPNPSEGQVAYMEMLADLIRVYEQENHSLDDKEVTPLDAIRFLMEQHGMNASALGKLLGERSLGSKILRGERGLSRAHVLTLSKHFNVNPSLFL